MFEEKLIVVFFLNIFNKVLVEVDICFKVLKIFSYYSDYNDFLKYMDILILYGKVGFGKM